MRLSVSALAWKPEEEDLALALLKKEGVSLVEHIPGRLMGTPRAERAWFEHRGLHLVAFQALLYGTKDLHLFRSEPSRRDLFSHLARLCRLARDLGVQALVFGSPRNRSIDESSMSRVQAHQLAREFFAEIGKAASSDGTRLCLETNPSSYGCNFLTRTPETIEFIRGVGSPGIRLNLDLGAISINREDPRKLVEEALDILGHVHISEPDLKPVGSLPETHPAHHRLARSLRDGGYDGIISIEMTRPPQGDGLAQAIRFVKEAYHVPA
jgi:sugar phosphate isomerase/epimerase